MAIKDYFLTFSDGQTLTTASAIDSENVIKLGHGTDAFGNAKDFDLGSMGEIFITVRCVTAFTMTTSTGTITCKLYKGSTESPATLVATGPAVTKPSAGTAIWRIAIPAGDLDDYLKLTYTLSTAASAGAVDAWIGLDSETK
jgi:hypothetical protein